MNETTIKMIVFIITIITVVVIIDPFKWKIPRLNSYLHELKSLSFYTSNRSMLWKDTLYDLKPVENLLWSECNGHKSSSECELKSYFDIQTRTKKIGVRLADEGVTIMQRFVGEFFKLSSLEFCKKIFGENPEGLVRENLQNLLEIYKSLEIGIDNNSASQVYSAIAAMNYIILESPNAIVDVDEIVIRKDKNFKKELQRMVDEHFRIGSWTSLDVFIRKWREYSLKENDIFIHIFITVLDHQKPHLNTLFNCYSTKSNRPGIEELKKSASEIIYLMDNFGKGYNSGDLIKQFFSLSRLINEGMKLT